MAGVEDARRARHRRASGAQRRRARLASRRAEVASSPAAPGNSLRTVLRGGAWGTGAQFLSLATNLALTPYIIHGLGLDSYGLYIYIASVSTFLSSFDGGILGSAQRFFAIYAGRDDAVQTTKLLTTLLVLVGAVGAALTGVMWVAAVPLTHLLHMPHHLRPQAVFMLRTIGFIVGVALVRNIPVAILQARQRFALTNATSASLYLLYIVGMIITIHNHYGLRGVALTLAGQQVLATVVLIPAVFRYLTPAGARLLPWSELRTFLGYSGKMQVIGFANLFLNEMDAILLGIVLPIRFVGVFNAGASFATTLRNIPINGVSPMLSVLGQSFGREGLQGMLEEFHRLQRLWVRAIAGWVCAGAGAAYFALPVWLGREFRPAGIVASIEILGYGAYLMTSVLTNMLGVVGRPGFEARFSVVMVIVNVTLTIPLVFTGPIGVAAATAAGQVVACIYLPRSVKKRWGDQAVSYLHEIPVLACVTTGAVVVGLELVIRGHLPSGPLGLLACAVPGAIGLGVYASLAMRSEMRAVGRRLALSHYAGRGRQKGFSV